MARVYSFPPKLKNPSSGPRLLSGYAELISKTNYSFLEGASHPEELIETALDLNLAALAITDRNGVYGLPKAYYALKNHSRGKFLKLICGAEVTMEEGLPSIILLPRDKKAYGVLCRTLTAVHADKEKGEGFLTWKELFQFMSQPAARGLIALPRDHPDLDYRSLKELFEDRIFFPLRRAFDGHDLARTQRALELERALDIPTVAVNDVRYHLPERRKLQDVLTATREGATLEEAGTKLLSNSESYLKSPEQMEHLFNDLPEAVARTVEIAESCSFDLGELRYRYPSEWIPEKHTAQSFLEELVWQGTKERYPDGTPPGVMKQIHHELSLIQQLQFADYFLTLWDIVKFARDRKILCQGRGSAANSVVCYCLHVTAIDPVRMNLLFERFISVERGEPPDIDVDFEHERREEVIQYIYEKYGRDRAAMVSAVVTYRSRSAIREVSKALGKEISREDFQHAPLDEDTCLQEGVPYIPEDERRLIEGLSDELKGFPRHLSIHSGGFTLSADPIIEMVPVEPARMEGRTIIQWDKYDLDILGLLKVDVLALGMLTALRKTLDQVGLELHTIPSEDPKTYKMMQRADTVGVFQIESRAQMNMLGRLQPKCFYDLVIEIAIVRPGPIVGKMVHPYLKRRRGMEPIVYPHPKLQDILGRTLGVPLFQEQVMKMAICLAGFSAGEADQLRKAIGAWRSSGSVHKVGKKLIAGLLRNGISKDYVGMIFEQIKGFAEYGFPESHSASFALLAYASSYLKCHHPAEFTCALVNSQPMGFYSVRSLVFDAQLHGVKVHSVHPNHSNWDCEVIDGEIQLGFRVCKGLRQRDAERLMEERKERPFRDLADFLARSRLRRDHLETLAMGDAFSCFGLDQRHALWEILFYELLMGLEDKNQLGLFAGLSIEDQKKSLFGGLGEYEKIQSDYQSFGLSTRGHPMTILRREMRNLPRWRTVDIKKANHGEWVSLAGLVICRQRPMTAGGTTFATLEDEAGLFDLVFHRKVYERYEDIFIRHSFFKIRGILQRDRDSASILVKRVKPFWDTPSEEKVQGVPSVSRDFH